MGWKVKLGGKSILMDDLTEDDFVAACEAYPETNWLRLYTSPGSSPGALYELLKTCAFRLEVAAPERPRNIKESVALLTDCLEEVDDDLPTAFGGEGVPLEVAVDQETTTSSTSTELEDGTPE